MPSSVRDRPTTAHEQVFLLTKSANYFYDCIGSSEPVTGGAHSRGSGSTKKHADENNAFVRNKRSWSESTKDAVETRNARTVWTLSTEPLREAHFAAFPTALVRRCLSAGISIDGVCGACGAPRVRIVERERVPTRPGTESKAYKQPAGWDCGPGNHDKLTGRYPPSATNRVHHDEEVCGNRDPERHVTRAVTKGWESSCDCEDATIEPALVLDPFIGAGTTAVAALRMGARAIGIELNPESVAIAEKRIQRTGYGGPLFTL